jgi:hypothetical protein
MLLKTQKKIAWGVVAAVALGGVGYELSGVFDHAAQPANTTVAQQHMPTPIATPDPVPVRPVERAPVQTQDEETVKVGKLQKGDINGLTKMNYLVLGRRLPFGHSCASGNNTDGLGSAGMGTAISYDVMKGDTMGLVCIEHMQKSDGGIHASPKVFVANEAVGKLQQGDVSGLTDHMGYTVLGRRLPFGHSCGADGNTDCLGSDGLLTAISYDVVKDGRKGRLCVEHSSNGKGGTHAAPKSFIPN